MFGKHCLLNGIIIYNICQETVYMKRYYNLFVKILPQPGAEIYSIPWGHIKLIVDKCKDKP